MPDDPTKQARDRQRINIHEAYEVEYWMKELGVSKERLEQLVRRHGDRADDVRRAINVVVPSKS